VNGNACRLEILSQMSDVVVEPGESRQTDTAALLSGPYDDTAPALFRWIAATLRRADPSRRPGRLVQLVSEGLRALPRRIASAWHLSCSVSANAYRTT